MVGENVRIHGALRNVRLLNTCWPPGAMHDAPPLSSSRRRFNRRVPSRTSSYRGTSARARVRTEIKGYTRATSHTLIRKIRQISDHVGMIFVRRLGYSLSCHTSPSCILQRFGVPVEQPIKPSSHMFRDVSIKAASARDDPAHNRLMIPIAETTRAPTTHRNVTGMTVDCGRVKKGP